MPSEYISDAIALVSDWLTAHGHAVLHIDATRPPHPHKLMVGARLAGKDLIYDGGLLFK